MLLKSSIFFVFSPIPDVLLTCVPYPPSASGTLVYIFVLLYGNIIMSTAQTNGFSCIDIPKDTINNQIYRQLCVYTLWGLSTRDCTLPNGDSWRMLLSSIHALQCKRAGVSVFAMSHLSPPTARRQWKTNAKTHDNLSCRPVWCEIPSAR